MAAPVEVERLTVIPRIGILGSGQKQGVLDEGQQLPRKAWRDRISQANGCYWVLGGSWKPVSIGTPVF